MFFLVIVKMSPTALLSYFKHIVNDVKNVENTKVIIKYDDQIQVAEYTPTRGFLSSAEVNNLNFGLGKTKKIDYLQVIWPNGQVNYLSDVKVNQNLNFLNLFIILFN